MARGKYHHWTTKELNFLVESRIHGVAMNTVAAVLEQSERACFARANKPDCTIRIMKGQSEIFKKLREEYEK